MSQEQEPQEEQAPEEEQPPGDAQPEDAVDLLENISLDDVKARIQAKMKV